MTDASPGGFGHGAGKRDRGAACLRLFWPCRNLRAKSADLESL